MRSVQLIFDKTPIKKQSLKPTMRRFNDVNKIEPDDINKRDWTKPFEK